MTGREVASLVVNPLAIPHMKVRHIKQGTLKQRFLTPLGYVLPNQQTGDWEVYLPNPEGESAFDVLVAVHEVMHINWRVDNRFLFLALSALQPTREEREVIKLTIKQLRMLAETGVISEEVAEEAIRLQHYFSRGIRLVERMRYAVGPRALVLAHVSMRHNISVLRYMMKGRGR